MPEFYMLIGIPASGKSTWLKKNMKPNSVIVSSDDYIEKEAKRLGKTYSEVFASTVKAAHAHMNSALKQAIKDKKNIYWDQTNLNEKTRNGKLANIPSGYKKTAVYFKAPSGTELARRLNSRPGKEIPVDVMVNMIKTITKPSKSEGFDEIIEV